MTLNPTSSVAPIVIPGFIPPPASHMVKAFAWWSRPRNLEPLRASFMGVRPNSPPQTTRVESSKPPLQVLDKPGNRTIGFGAHERELVDDIRVVCVAVRIPAAVEELDAAYAALKQQRNSQ